MSGFAEGFNNAGAAYNLSRQIMDEGDQRRKQSGLAALAADYAQGGQPDYQGIAANGGDPMAFRKDADSRQQDMLKQAGQIAGYLASLPDPQSRAQAYASVLPKLQPISQALGVPLLPVWDEAHLPELQQIAQAFGGMGQSASGVQASFVDAQGNRVAIMRDGSTKVLGQNAPNNQIIAGDGGFFGVNKGTLNASPVTIGGSAPQMPPQAAPQPASTFALDDAALQSLASLPPQERAAALQAMMTGGDFHVGPQGQPVQGLSPGVSAPMGQQLRPAPKPVASAGPQKPPVGYRWNAAGNLEAIPGGPAQVAIDARQHAADAKLAAQQVRQAEAADSATQLTSAIDQLMNSPGFAVLGTTQGDMQQAVPYLRTDAKDASAQLQNIAGQVALTTMSKLKALSTQGATGFGALSEKELGLLQNSIATLQSDKISNAQLRQSLETIRQSMKKIAEWNPQAKPAPVKGAVSTKPGAAPKEYTWNPKTGKLE